MRRVETAHADAVWSCATQIFATKPRRALKISSRPRDGCGVLKSMRQSITTRFSPQPPPPLGIVTPQSASQCRLKHSDCGFLHPVSPFHLCVFPVTLSSTLLHVLTPSQSHFTHIFLSNSLHDDLPCSGNSPLLA